jgi:hypothetical protein
MEQYPEFSSQESKKEVFKEGDEVVGEKDGWTIVRRRMIRTPMKESKPHRMEAYYRLRREGYGTIEKLEHGSERDLGLATKEDLAYKKSARENEKQGNK